MVTFIWNFLIVFAYNIVSILIFILWALLFGSIKFVGPIILISLAVIYLSGFVYISIIWHLASVVSVLEEFYGLNAVTKSQGLIRGKTGISAATFLVLILIFFGIQLGFEYFVVLGFGDHLGGYLGDYVPLKTKDVQLGEFEA
ncbi:unnamed protein product [Fraxinus pennsylvanica]|uniref:Uncharacterized protein n=1 Tax=Fraxinus pennsylvanica TaxID=56036 RepID=A0AAD1Z5Z3_9LAMI|nr:unnamed protein product [Fraxinus pennsylvanica]